MPAGMIHLIQTAHLAVTLSLYTLISTVYRALIPEVVIGFIPVRKNGTFQLHQCVQATLRYRPRRLVDNDADF